MFNDRHGLKLYFVVLGDIMIGRSKIRTPEQRTKKMLNEESTIMNLELAVKKEEFKMNAKTKPRFHERSKFDIEDRP